eukprot:UN07617
MVMSPFEVLSYQYSSCSGYSIFMTAILRSIGIPSRVGTPQWINCSSPMHCNHNWIEIYDDNGCWSFTNAWKDGVAAMNQTWFYPEKTNGQIAGNTNNSIFASSYAPTNNITHFIMEWDYPATYVHAWDVTNNYHTNST